MCRRAVGHDGSYLQYVPEKWKTPELCMEAIRRSPYAIAHLPESMKSPDLYMSLVRENPQNLKGVPREARTPEMSREAFERTYGKGQTEFLGYQRVERPRPGLAGVPRAGRPAEDTPVDEYPAPEPPACNGGGGVGGRSQGCGGAVRHSQHGHHAARGRYGRAGRPEDDPVVPRELRTADLCSMPRPPIPSCGFTFPTR